MAAATSGPRQLISIVARAWEQAGPYFIGAAAGAVVYVYGIEIGVYVAEKNWNIGAVYTGVFDVSAILTGLLFGFYSILKSGGNEFMKRLSRSRAYAFLMARVKTAMLICLSVTAFSLPMMVVEPFIGTSQQIDIAVSLWVGLSVTMFAMTWSAARLFLLVLEA